MAVVASCLAPAVVWGHAFDPAARRLFDLGDAWMWDTTFGPMTSDAPGQYICEEAFLGGEDYRIAPMSTTTWYTASLAGLMRTDDGCSFEKVLDLGEVPVSLEAHPPSGRLALLTNETDAAALRWSEDGAGTWRDVALPGDGVQWTALRYLSESEVLISGYERMSEPAGLSVLLRVGLETGDVTTVPGVEDMTYLYIYDTNAGEFVGIAGVGRELRIVHGTAGEELAREELGAWPTGMVFEPASGDLVVTVSLPDPQGGYVLRGSRPAEGEPRVWETLEEGHSSRCVGSWNGEVFLCARRDREMHDVSRLGSEAPFLSFVELEGPRTSCGPETNVGTTCPVVWQELARALQIPGFEPPDMGVMPDMGDASDMAADMGGGDMATDPGGEVGGGCSSVGGPAGRLEGLFVLLGLWWRRRRRA